MLRLLHDWLDKYMYIVLAFSGAILVPFFMYLFMSSENFIVSSGKSLDALDKFYFSVITFTTLGYGDIAPNSNIAKSIVLLQAILGPVILGFFLNVLATSIASEQTQDRVKREKFEINRTQRSEKFEKNQRIFRNCYRACVVLFDNLNFEFHVVKSKEVCFATLDEHWMVIHNVHHDSKRTESQFEKYLLTTREHILSCGECTERQIKFMENNRSIFAIGLERIYLGGGNLDSVDELLSDQISKILEQHDYLVLYANDLLKNEKESVLIERYFDAWWMLFLDVHYLLRMLELPDSVSIIDHDMPFRHPFEDVNISEWIFKDWRFNQRIRLVRRLGS